MDIVFIYFLLGLLQVIGIGLSVWVLTTMVKVLERLAKLEVKIEEIPIAEIKEDIRKNRHRINQLDSNQAELRTEMSTLRKAVESIKNYCNHNHGGNL